MNIEEVISVVNVLKSKENSENINNPKHKYVLMFFCPKTIHILLLLCLKNKTKIIYYGTRNSTQ